MSTAPNISFKTRAIYSDASDLTSGTRINLNSTNLRLLKSRIRAAGNRGRRARDMTRVRDGNRRATGNIISTPSDLELDYILPKALGGALTSVGDTLGFFYVGIDKVEDIYSYECVASRLQLSGQVGQPVQMTVDLEGKDETSGVTWPLDDPGLDDDTESFFILSDLTATLAGTARDVPGFTLSIDNMLDAERFMNSTTREFIPALDCQITLELQVPFNADNTDLYTIAEGGIDGSIALSDGTDTYTFTFGKLDPPDQEGPSVEERQELMLPIALEAFRDNKGTPENQISIAKT